MGQRDGPLPHRGGALDPQPAGPRRFIEFVLSGAGQRILAGPAGPGVGPCGGGVGIDERRAQTLPLAIMTPLGSNLDAALALSALLLLPSLGVPGGVRLLSASRGVFAR